MSHSVEQLWSSAALHRGVSSQGGPIGHCPRSWLGSLRSPPLYFPQTTPDAPARTARGAGTPLQRKADSSTAARRTVRQPGEGACSTEIKRSEPKASEPFGRTGLEFGCPTPGVPSQGGPIGHCPRSWLGSLRSPPLYFPQATPDAPARTARGAGAPLQRKADSSTAARRTVRQPGEGACSTEIKRSEPKASEPFGRTGLELGCPAPGFGRRPGLRAITRRVRGAGGRCAG